MRFESEQNLLWGVALILAGVFLLIALTAQFLKPVRAEDILAFTILGATAAVISLVGGGASMAKWAKNNNNWKMIVAIFNAFSKEGVIKADKLEDSVKEAFDRLKKEKAIKGSFDEKRFPEAIMRLRIEGHICVDHNGEYFWWEHTYKDVPFRSTASNKKIQPTSSVGG